MMVLVSGLIHTYLQQLHDIVQSCSVDGQNCTELDEALQCFIVHAVQAHEQGKKVIFIGNGGSAGICSHAAIDYSKNGGIRSLACNDGATLTCLSNDYGYEHVFEKQIEWHAQEGDIVVAISSSGQSQNIIRASQKASEKKCFVVTFSGFEPSNPLRSMGDLNVYLHSREYGFVELGHQIILHAALDLKETLIRS